MKKQYHYYMRDQKNKLRERLDGQEHSLKKIAESKVNYEENYGKHPELIVPGSLDRICGCAPQILENEEKQKSYDYGFFKRGSILLAGTFEKGEYSAEEQRQFGITDLNNGVKNDELLNLINYQNYMNGRIYQMGKDIYNYITENNISIDDYISLMSTFNKNVTNQEFKNGYYDQKIELEGQKKEGR